MSVLYEKYLEEVSLFSGKYAFRGQKNRSWKLHSAATRRLIQHYDSNEDISTSEYFWRMNLIYHRAALLEPARKYGFGVEEGRKIPDMQLLAKLQHFGAATGLIDFTWDPLVALWFASESCLDEAGNETSGIVYAVNLSDEVRFQNLSSDEESLSAEEILSPSNSPQKQLYWEAMFRGDATPRVLRQQSVFVIGRPIIPESVVTSIEILASDKQEILRELESVHNINRQTLFTDLQGFSSANGPDSLLPTLENSVNYLFQGHLYSKQKDFPNAVSSLERCIELDSDACEPYFLKGNAWTELENYNKALQDFNLAIRYRDRFFLSWDRDKRREISPVVCWPLYFNRGNARAALSEFIGARADYDRATQLSKELRDPIAILHFNRGNACFMLGEYDAAVEDYSIAIGAGIKDAWFNKGNALILSGRFEEAVEAFRRATEEKDDHTGYLGNLSWAEYILDEVSESKYKVYGPYKSDRTLMTYIDVSIESTGRETGIESLIFKGNVGNFGNVGIGGSPTTKGYRGTMGFMVRI